MYDVVTIGSATRDVFLTSQAFAHGISATHVTLPLGAKIAVDDIVFETGGAGTNTATAFARLGFRTAYLGRIGATDLGGQEILKQLEDDRVATQFVRRDPRHRTAYSIILLAASGERTVLVYRGAAAHLAPNDVPRTLQSRWLYVSALGGSLPLLKRIFTHARNHRSSVAWNPGAAELRLGLSRMKPMLRQTTVLLLNLDEARQLTRMRGRAASVILRRLAAVAAGTVVITAGSRGAIAHDNGHSYRTVPRRIKTRNRTGAGDAFGSGLVAGLLQRPGDITFALQLGSANAEAVIQMFGAKRGLLRRLPGVRQRVQVRESRT